MTDQSPLEHEFDTFKTEAFRLEVLSQYLIEDSTEAEEFRDYMNGGLFPRPANQDWHDLISNWTMAGKSIVRLRVVPNTISSYFKYEVEWCYPFNLKAGEQIFMIEESEFTRLFPTCKNDFWLFDNSKVVRLNYNSDGAYISDEYSKDDLKSVLKVKTLIESPHVVSLVDYLKLNRAGIQ